MKIRVLGCGWYGAHLSTALIADGHEVEVHEIADHIFAGASGGNPARCHLGFHYPRSGLTQQACQEHHAEFMEVYGHLTRPVPLNLYCVAAQDSLIDFTNYCNSLRGRVQFVTVNPAEFGLQNIEGAVLTGERHVVIREARTHFAKVLADRIRFGVSPVIVDDPRWELTLDTTFCANDADNIDRFEPCVTVLLEGPVDRATTIMDGPFPGLYVWDEEAGLSSLTSASLTPISKKCPTWAAAKAVLDGQTAADLCARGQAMMLQMADFWPAVRDLYRIADYKLSIRAMPRSAADARLVDVVRVGERALRVRAGKIDAVFHAERLIKAQLREWRREINRAVVA